MQKNSQGTSHFPESLLSPCLKTFFITKKEGEGVVVIFAVYGCFLRTNSTRTMTTTSAMNKPTIAGRKYRSAIDGGISVGAAVASAAGSTTKYVSAEDDQ